MYSQRLIPKTAIARFLLIMSRLDVFESFQNSRDWMQSSTVTVSSVEVKFST